MAVSDGFCVEAKHQNIFAKHHTPATEYSGLVWKLEVWKGVELDLEVGLLLDVLGADSGSLRRPFNRVGACGCAKPCQDGVWTLAATLAATAIRKHLLPWPCLTGMEVPFSTSGSYNA